MTSVERPWFLLIRMPVMELEAVSGPLKNYVRRVKYWKDFQPKAELKEMEFIL